MKTSIATKMLDDVLLVYNSPDPPTDEEWPAYIKLQSNTKLPVLVVTDGGAPNVKQRSEINAHMAGRKVAVLTDDKIALAVLTALFWFNKSMRGFPSGHWVPALKHLGVATSPELVQREIEILRHRVQRTRAAS